MRRCIRTKESVMGVGGEEAAVPTQRCAGRSVDDK